LQRGLLTGGRRNERGYDSSYFVCNSLCNVGCLFTFEDIIMLKRDPSNPRNIIMQQRPSKAAERLVLTQNYISDDHSRAVDMAVDKLGMDCRDVEKAVVILTALFDAKENNVPTKQIQWLITKKLALTVGVMFTETEKRVQYKFTKTGKAFFEIMFGRGNSPRVIKRQNVDGYALVKYAILEECLV
jgi:hypothetical protein